MRRINPHHASLSRRDFLQLGTKIVLASLCSSQLGCELRAPLRIAGHVFPGYEFIFLARNEKILDAKQVQLVETSSASESLAALFDQRVDGAMLTLDEVLSARAKGLPLTIVLILDRSAGADALLADSSITSIRQLQGKRVGVENSAVGKLFLHHALERANLAPSEITLLNVPVNQHLSACARGEVDAVVTFEPSLSKIAAIGWHNLIDSRDIDVIYDVLAIRTDQLKWYPNQVVHLTQSHLKAVQLWQKNPIDTAYRLAQRLGVDVQNIPSLYKGLELPDLDFNRHILSESNPKLIQIAAQIAGTLGYDAALDSAEKTLMTATYLPDRLL